MTNVSHASLSGSQLHEPKGIETALSGQVYVSNGASSGSWSDIGTSSFTGMIADFATPVAPVGWLELDGSVISTSTFSGLYGVMAMQSSGTRTNSQSVITSIPSTANFKVGYNIFGVGINAGTTIVSIDSATQVTISSTASSSGTGAFAVSPWVLGTGTIQLPNTSTTGAFRRSRSSTTKVGDIQTNQNAAHTHTLTGAPGVGTLATDTQGNHTHSVSDPGHGHGNNAAINVAGVGVTGGGSFFVVGGGAATVSPTTTGISLFANGSHAHNITGAPTVGTLATASVGGTETRPNAIVVITCIKT
jgi:hypothetical protein